MQGTAASAVQWPGSIAAQVAGTGQRFRGRQHRIKSALLCRPKDVEERRFITVHVECGGLRLAPGVDMPNVEERRFSAAFRRERNGASAPV